MKITKKLTIVMLVVAVALTMILGTMTFAATTGTTAGTVTVSSDNSNKITVTRNVTGVTNPVSNTFTYTLTKVSGPDGVTNLPTGTTITFDGTETITSETVTKSSTIDFAGATFTKIGDYKFTITETATGDADNYPLDSTVYTTYVSVRNEVNPTTNVPTGNLIATVMQQGSKTGAAPDATTGVVPGKENVVFTSEVQTTSIELTKTVTGTMGELDKSFTFTVTLPGAATNNYSATVAGTATTLHGGANTITLKHGETMHVDDLPIGANVYTIAETDLSDYTEKYKVGAGSQTTGVSTGAQATVAEVTDGVTPDTNKVAFENNKEEPTITGVFMDVAPFIALIALAIVGIYAIKKTSQRD